MDARTELVASSDSGGGAGIQADLTAFARCCAHGISVIVALTAQNTVDVAATHGAGCTLPRSRVAR